jgi:hypothetical protein
MIALLSLLQCCKNALCMESAQVHSLFIGSVKYHLLLISLEARLERNNKFGAT